MSGPGVAIIAAGPDQTALGVAQAVAALGGRSVFVDTSQVPEQTALTVAGREVRFGDESLDALKSLYVKSIHFGAPLYDPDDIAQRPLASYQAQWVAERERHALMTSALRSLDDGTRAFVNPVRLTDLHLLKVQQVALLEARGVPVPASLATTDGAALRAFAERHPVIYKPLAGGALARALGPEDLTPERMRALRRAPVLFQERIVGRELRVYVLRGAVVGAFEVPTEGVVDARLNVERAFQTEAPTPVAEVCVRAAQALELPFTAVDVRLTDAGRAVVLECNPTPSIAFYQSVDGGPIVQALAQDLLAHA